MMVAKRFKANFDIILERLSELGYRHSWKVVNATDFGVGQNRRRLICVSVLGREPPMFPEPKGSFRPLRDYLEPSGAVPDSYFLTEERLKGVIWSSDKESGRGNGFRFQPCPPPTTGLQAQSTQNTDGRQTRTSLQIGMLMTYGLEMHNRVWSIDHASPTVTAAQGGGTMTKIAVPEGRTPVRELTPRECLRLMGFLDEEIDRIIGSYSKTRLRMFAGDAVVVDMFIGVLGSIYGEVADDAC